MSGTLHRTPHTLTLSEVAPRLEQHVYYQAEFPDEEPIGDLPIKATPRLDVDVVVEHNGCSQETLVRFVAMGNGYTQATAPLVLYAFTMDKAYYHKAFCPRHYLKCISKGQFN